MLTGGLEETTDPFVMVRLLHIAHWLALGKGSWTLPRSVGPSQPQACLLRLQLSGMGTGKRVVSGKRAAIGGR